MARYNGNVMDDTMRLFVSLPDLARTIGAFTLKLGSAHGWIDAGDDWSIGDLARGLFG